MTASRYDLLVVREGREGKKFYTKIGAAFPTKTGGFSLSFDALPLPDRGGNCRVLMAEPREQTAKPATGARQVPRDDFDDSSEIPF